MPEKKTYNSVQGQQKQIETFKINIKSLNTNFADSPFKFFLLYESLFYNHTQGHRGQESTPTNIVV